MSETLKITVDWEKLSNGFPEEIATFGLFKIVAYGSCITTGSDRFVNRLRDGPLVAAYYSAEWFAWNWWRLLWEISRFSPEWQLSHKMSSIGQGYVWPNITISTDGQCITLRSEPSSETASSPFRSINSSDSVFSAAEFEGAVDIFINQVIAQLRAEDVPETNLDRIWQELTLERLDAEAALYRRFEALAGHDPGEINENQIELILSNAKILGEQAMQDIVSQQRNLGKIMTAEAVREEAGSKGVDFQPKDVIRLTPNPKNMFKRSDTAWKVGKDAAKAVRSQQQLGVSPVRNSQIEEMAAVSRNIIEQQDKSGSDWAFSLSEKANSKIVLKSRWETGRRFELSRLIGDNVCFTINEKLKPVTEAPSYRQKVQRAFAAEFLCPLDPLVEKMNNDYSSDGVKDAAIYFNVSEQTVTSILRNHRLI